MTPEVKVYEVLLTFEVNGLTYQAGEKYELSTDVVATLPEGTVVEYVVPPVEPAATPEASTTAPVETTEAPAAQPAKPWVGGHVVGRE